MTVKAKANKRDVKKSTPLPVMGTGTKPVAEVIERTANSPLLLGELSYRKLRKMAKELGLKTSGDRADLIERLS